ncbi:MAG: threonine/serine dehydratase [Sinobacteraceae bacterium]|nr:threonine/serine dehydratase [Nevskiaceae bacterium]MBV9316202.1 threonine/serine dehydratase [Gammaproteobacteria bacterium]
MIDKALLNLAWKTVRKAVRWTPLLHSEYLDSVVGARIFLKAESLQIGGSFKMRGAYFRVSRLSRQQRQRGVVAFSSGNFAQALALAGQRAGVPVTIVMPHDAPQRKIELTQRAGANVVLTQHGERNREEVASERAREIAQEQACALLHPFDDPFVVAGQSTLMREVLVDLEREQLRVDAILCPVGGGGLIAGTALAEEHFGHGAEVIAVEPAACDDMCRSLISHRRERNVGTPRTICDAMQAVSPGAVPFEAAAHLIARGIAVEDDAVRRAMRIAFEEFKIVLEPSGAIALAAALEHRESLAGRTLVLLCCGGSVSIEDLLRLTATATTH